MLSERELQNLFPKQNPTTIQKLYQDKELRKQISQQIADRILQKTDILEINDYQTLSALFSKANFAYSSDECVYVAKIIEHYTKRTEILPLVTEHQGADLASRCLVSLSMFPNAIKKRSKRHGAPTSNFYRKIGIKTFETIGRKDVSTNFTKWEKFIPWIFNIKK